MRAVGESLGLGRTFAEAFVKAMEGRESRAGRVPSDDALARAAQPLPERWDLLLEAARRGLDPPGIHPYFADRLRELAASDSPSLGPAGAGSRSTRARASSRRGRPTTTSRYEGDGRGAAAVAAAP